MNIFVQKEEEKRKGYEIVPWHGLVQKPVSDTEHSVASKH